MLRRSGTCCNRSYETIVALISPIEEWRKKARKTCGSRFMEIYVKAKIDNCIRRDLKNLDKKVFDGLVKKGFLWN